MTVAMPKILTSLSPNGLVDAVTGLFGHNGKELEQLVPLKRFADGDVPEVSGRVDQIRYEQMLDRELDRQLLTEVEQNDTDMLNRVRAALYEE